MTIFRDTWIVFSRSMALAIRQPIWVVVGLMQPVLYLALFGPLLVPLANSPGFPPGDAWQVFVPGILVQLGIFGGLFVGFAIVAEWRYGVIDRMMVTPASRAALIAGRVLRDVIVLVVQAILLLICAYFFGLRVPPVAVVLGLVVIALLGAAFSALSYSAGLALKSEDALAPLMNMLALPILLLSGILLPMTLAPRWLQILSDLNPFKHIVDTVRALFRGEVASGTVALGMALAVMLVAVSAWVGTRVFSAQTN